MINKKSKWKTLDIDVITDYSKVPKELNPAFGIIVTQGKDYKDESHYYFGVHRYCSITLFNEEEDKRIKVKQKLLTLVKDDRTTLICDDSTLKSLNYELKDNLLLNKSPWLLEHTDKYLAGDKAIITVEAKQPKELFEQIKKQFEYYLDLPESEWYDYLTLWVIGSYFYSFFSTYPMIYLYGLKNTGKTKIMTLCSYMAFNGSMYVGITPATLFRIVQANHPSLFLDEIEKLIDKKREGSADIEAMLNSGYKKGATVPRCEKEGGKQIVKQYDVYCPKMFAHVEGKVSRTLISRCIRIVMQRAKPKDKRADRWMEKHNKVWQDIRNELYVFGLEYWNHILYYYEGTKEIQKEINLENRDWELWKPILVLAKIVDDNLYKQMGVFAEKTNKEYQKDEKEGWEYIIVKVLNENVDSDRYYFVSEIRAWLMDEFEKEEEVPKTRSIGWELKRLGLTDRKKEGNKGHKWYLSKQIVNNLVLKLNVTEETALEKNENKTSQTAQTAQIEEIEGKSSAVSAVSIHDMDIPEKNKNKEKSTPLTPPTRLTTLTALTALKVLIDRLSDTSNKGLVPIDTIYSEANKAQISEENVEKGIEQLKKEMMLYEPRSGYLKRLE